MCTSAVRPGIAQRATIPGRFRAGNILSPVAVLFLLSISSPSASFHHFQRIWPERRVAFLCADTWVLVGPVVRTGTQRERACIWRPTGESNWRRMAVCSWQCPVIGHSPWQWKSVTIELLLDFYSTGKYSLATDTKKKGNKSPVSRGSNPSANIG